MSDAEDWRGLLDAGLDAMKVGRHEEAERTFDELDELHAGWHFEVPYRNRKKRQITTSRRRTTSGRLTRVINECDREHRARRLLAAMFHLVHEENNHHRGRSYGHRQLAVVFGVRTETVRTWARRGAVDLGIVDEHGDLVPIETDFDPDERKRALKRQLVHAGDRSRKLAERQAWEKQRHLEFEDRASRAS